MQKRLLAKNRIKLGISQAKVKEVVQAFQAGKRDQAEFRIEMSGKMIYIRYFPVRDDACDYMGVVEATQDVIGIRKLSGQKRLLDEDNQ